jgi:Putative restriction endonuclease
MKTVVLGEPPAALSSLISQRQRLGQDTHDEIWDGDYHMAPAANGRHGEVQALLTELLGPLARTAGLRVTVEFNLGDTTNFRVPDIGIHRQTPHRTWFATAALVCEVRSPDDESWQKFDFYYDAGVEEVVIFDLDDDTIYWFARGASEYIPVEASVLLNVSVAEVAGFVAEHSAS